MVIYTTIIVRTISKTPLCKILTEELTKNQPLTVQSRKKYAGHFNHPYQQSHLFIMASYHRTMTIQTLPLLQTIQITKQETLYLGTARFTRGQVSPIEWSVISDLYQQAWGILLNGSKVPVCIDTAVPRSFMTEDFYDLHPLLINHTKCKADITKLEIANGVYVPIKFMILLVISFKGHMFEILTLVSEIKGSKLLVLGMKSIVEMEGTLESKDNVARIM